MGRLTWRLPPHLTVETEVSASPGPVWTLLTDVTRVGEWSHECRAASWLVGDDRARVGARFAGKEPQRRTALEASLRDHRAGARGAVGLPHERRAPSRLHGVEVRARTDRLGGSLVRQSFQVVRLPLVTELMILALLRPQRDRAAALRADLVRLGEVAAGQVHAS